MGEFWTIGTWFCGPFLIWIVGIYACFLWNRYLDGRYGYSDLRLRIEQYLWPVSLLIGLISFVFGGPNKLARYIGKRRRLKLDENYRNRMRIQP